MIFLGSCLGNRLNGGSLPGPQLTLWLHRTTLVCVGLPVLPSRASVRDREGLTRGDVVQEAGSEDVILRALRGCVAVLNRRGLETASLGSACSGVTDMGQMWRYFLQGPRAQTGDSSPGDSSVSCVLGCKEFRLLRPDVQTPWKSSEMGQNDL